MSNEPGHILIIEDEKVFAKALQKHLQKKNYNCTVCDHLADVDAAMIHAWPQLILCDIRLPDGSGMDLVEKLAAAATPSPPIIMMSAYGDMDDVITALRAGVGDYLKKPFDLEELDLRMEKVLQHSRLKRSLDYSKARERDPQKSKQGKQGKTNDNIMPSIIGEATSTTQLRGQLLQIADIAGKSEIPPTVLLTGETGTGKGLAARSLHAVSNRANKPFVQIDCASLPADIIEAELFGHTKGAFTDAHASRTGLIEAAEDGVVFMDEIGELPLTLQTKLLAILDRRMLRRVGTSSEVPIRAWFIAASNRDLQAMTTGNVSFRPDLYYRLNVLSIKMPALRERSDDIMLLARHFAESCCRRYGFTTKFTKDAERAINGWHWPGNIRELAHSIERAVLLGKGNISAQNLPNMQQDSNNNNNNQDNIASNQLPPPPAAATPDSSPKRRKKT